MALSKRAHVCQWMFPLFLTHLHQVCPFPHLVLFVLLLSHFFSRFIAVCLLLSLLFLSDKLDEILAAAQQTISTNEAPGTRGQGPKRDRGRSFYGNEVCIRGMFLEDTSPCVWNVCLLLDWRDVLRFDSGIYISTILKLIMLQTD